jgi:hypothetical protein
VALVVGQGALDVRPDPREHDAVAPHKLDVNARPQAAGADADVHERAAADALPLRYMSRATPPTGLCIITRTAPTLKSWRTLTRAT